MNNTDGSLNYKLNYEDECDGEDNCKHCEIEAYNNYAKIYNTMLSKLYVEYHQLTETKRKQGSKTPQLAYDVEDISDKIEMLIYFSQLRKI